MLTHPSLLQDVEQLLRREQRFQSLYQPIYLRLTRGGSEPSLPGKGPPVTRQQLLRIGLLTDRKGQPRVVAQHFPNGKISIQKQACDELNNCLLYTSPSPRD